MRFYCKKLLMQNREMRGYVKVRKLKKDDIIKLLEAENSMLVDKIEDLEKALLNKDVIIKMQKSKINRLEGK